MTRSRQIGKLRLVRSLAKIEKVKAEGKKKEKKEEEKEGEKRRRKNYAYDISPCIIFSAATLFSGTRSISTYRFSCHSASLLPSKFNLSRGRGAYLN